MFKIYEKSKGGIFMAIEDKEEREDAGKINKKKKKIIKKMAKD